MPVPSQSNPSPRSVEAVIMEETMHEGFVELMREWQMVRVKVVTVMRWYAQDEVNQEESEQNDVDGMKKGADYTGEVMHI